MTENYLYWLDQIQPADRHLVGDKAFYLSYLLQRAYPVVPGFVISAQVFRDFLATINWLEPLFADLPDSSLHLKVDSPRQLQAIAQNIRYGLETTPLAPEWLAAIMAAVSQLGVEQEASLILRPSLIVPTAPGAIAPFKTSGLLEAHICLAEPEAIALALKQTWAELFRAKTLLCWQRHGISLQQVNLAVVIQPLQAAIASGDLRVAQTQFDIQSSWGLGMAQVRGEVLPDYYQVQPESGIVQTQRLGSKTIAYQPVLSCPLAQALHETTSAQPVVVPEDRPQPIESLQADNWLHTYLLSEAQQRQYALADAELQALIQLTQRLRADLGHSFYLEWVLSSVNNQAAPQLYFTQLNPRVADHVAVEPLPPSKTYTPEEPSRVSTVRTQIANVPSRSGPSKDVLEEIGAPVVGGLAAAAGWAIARAQVLTDSSTHPDAVPSGSILVAPSITPDWLPLLKQAAGIVAEQGGMTCHGAIVARELGIPAVVGAANATQVIQTGTLILVNGNEGKIYALKDAAAINRLTPTPGKALNQSLSVSSVMSQTQSDPIQTAPPAVAPEPQRSLATQLMVNLSQPNSIERAVGLPVDGVGLLRSELLAIEVLEHQHPDLWLQQGRQTEFVERMAAHIGEFARAFAPRPVFYRSLDLRSDEFQALEGGQEFLPESNPMLGLRGAFRYLLDPALFDLELAALVQVQESGYRNVHLMLPFVRQVEEFVFCRQRVERAGLTQHPEFQLWIMAEVPSILFLLPDYVKAGVQGVSIGTNDLTQLLLGVDRHQAQMASVFNERHPAVMQTIAQLIREAKQAGIPCSLCGQAPVSYPELIDQFVRWGITSISVNPGAVEQTYGAIARAEQRIILEAARLQLEP